MTKYWGDDRVAVDNADMKILLVDGFPTMRRVVKTLMRQNGYSRFIEVEDGQAACEVLRASHDIGLIISSGSMPRMSGVEFLKVVRADPLLKHLPFLLVAAEAEKELVAEAVEAGVSGYVVKPFTGQALGAKIARIFASCGPKKAV